MGRMQREKGKVGERKLATALRKAFPSYTVRRRGGEQARRGDDAVDVEIEDFPLKLWWESKFGTPRNNNVRAALAQAVEAAQGTGYVPIAVIRDNRKQPFVVLRFDDLLGLIRLALRGVQAEADDGEP